MTPPEERGKGYGTEVAALLVNYAFNHLNLHKVWGKVHADNGGLDKNS
ncbi:GNAT family N-acetyltransferase [Thermococcus peptonophilus]